MMIIKQTWVVENPFEKLHTGRGIPMENLRDAGKWRAQQIFKSSVE